MNKTRTLAKYRKQAVWDVWQIIWDGIDPGADVTGDGQSRRSVADAPRKIGMNPLTPIPNTDRRQLFVKVIIPKLPFLWGFKNVCHFFIVDITFLFLCVICYARYDIRRPKGVSVVMQIEFRSIT